MIFSDQSYVSCVFNTGSGKLWFPLSYIMKQYESIFPQRLKLEYLKSNITVIEEGAKIINNSLCYVSVFSFQK